MSALQAEIEALYASKPHEELLAEYRELAEQARLNYRAHQFDAELSHRLFVLGLALEMGAVPYNHD